MQTIFLALGSYINISNIVRGKLLPALANKYRVVVLTEHIDQDKAREQRYFKHPNVVYEVVKMRRKKFIENANYLRTVLVRAFDHFSNTRDWYYRPSLPRRLRLAILMGGMLPRRFPHTKHFTWLEKLLIKPSDRFKELIENYRPKLFISATPGYMYSPLETELVLYAKKLGLPTCAVDMSFDNPYSQPKYMRETDYLCVWNDRMKRDYMQVHNYKDDRVIVTGCLKFDHYFSDRSEFELKTREKFLKSKNLDPGKKLVAYATPTPGTYPPRREFMQALVDAHRGKKFAGDPNILVRLHPLDHWSAYREFTNIPGIHIEKAGTEQIDEKKIKGASVEMTAQDQLNLTETLVHADTLIEYASTLIVEACIFNTPSLSIGFPKAQRPLVDVELTRDIVAMSGEKVASNFAELMENVNGFLTHQQNDDDLKRDASVVKEFVQFTDGLSWQRTAELIDKIIADYS
jgi:hypothetical protein